MSQSSPGGGVLFRKLKTDWNNKVFVSYSRVEYRFAYTFSRSLQRLGLNAWVDIKNLHAGDRLRGAIVAEIQSSSFFLPIIDRTYFESRWCQFELARARRLERRGQLAIIPVLLEERAAPRWIRERIWLRADLTDPRALAYEVYSQVYRRAGADNPLEFPWQSSADLDEFKLRLFAYEGEEQFEDDEEGDPFDRLEKMASRAPSAEIAEFLSRYIIDTYLAGGWTSAAFFLFRMGPGAATHIADVLSHESDAVIAGTFEFLGEMELGRGEASAIFRQIRQVGLGQRCMRRIEEIFGIMPLPDEAFLVTVARHTLI